MDMMIVKNNAMCHGLFSISNFGSNIGGVLLRPYASLIIHRVGFRKLHQSYCETHTGSKYAIQAIKKHGPENSCFKADGRICKYRSEWWKGLPLIPRMIRATHHIIVGELAKLRA
jgi:putative component of membrane protein insertase Oxa1/YidC/SpoIIIJ protein YidD